MKKELRQQMLTYLKQIPKEQHVYISEQIVNRLLQSAPFQRAKTIAVTMSNYPEIETRALIEQAWLLGKKIVVPKSNPATKTMIFYELTHFNQLEVVYANIEEPIEGVCEAVATEQIELVIVPGVVFNERGFRIGFGGGYYDRFLSQYYGQTIALALEEQVKAHIPVDAHDLPVQQIITNRRMIQCTEEKRYEVND